MYPKFISLFTIFMVCITMAQDKFSIVDYANFAKYKEANLKLDTKAENRVVFMGNSITEAWVYKSPDFFKGTGYVGRGISGQVTHQMLLRFKADVISLTPRVVVILAGTNDIAQNSGYVELESIAENIYTMAELASFQGIKVILCSVLPAIDFPWRKGIEPAQKIVTLNEMIKTYAEKNNFQYVDYWAAMVDSKGGLKVPEFTTADDLVHPNENGYKVMEKLVTPAIEKALGE